MASSKVVPLSQDYPVESRSLSELHFRQQYQIALHLRPGNASKLAEFPFPLDGSAVRVPNDDDQLVVVEVPFSGLYGDDEEEEFLEWFVALTKDPAGAENVEGPTDVKDFLRFPASLSKEKRAEWHKRAEKNGLHSFSKGFRSERHLIVMLEDPEKGERAGQSNWNAQGRIESTHQQRTKAMQLWKWCQAEGGAYLNYSKGELIELLATANVLPPDLARLQGKRAMAMRLIKHIQMKEEKQALALLQKDRSLVWVQDDECGGYPLHVAAFQGMEAIVAFIIQQTSTLQQRDLKYRKPIELAQRRKHYDIVEMMKAAEPSSSHSPGEDFYNPLQQGAQGHNGQKPLPAERTEKTCKALPHHSEPGPSKAAANSRPLTQQPIFKEAITGWGPLPGRRREEEPTSPSHRGSERGFDAQQVLERDETSGARPYRSQKGRARIDYTQVLAPCTESPAEEQQTVATFGAEDARKPATRSDTEKWPSSPPYSAVSDASDEERTHGLPTKPPPPAYLSESEGGEYAHRKRVSALAKHSRVGTSSQEPPRKVLRRTPGRPEESLAMASLWDAADRHASAAEIRAARRAEEPHRHLSALEGDTLRTVARFSRTVSQPPVGAHGQEKGGENSADNAAGRSSQKIGGTGQFALQELLGIDQAMGQEKTEKPRADVSKAGQPERGELQRSKINSNGGDSPKFEKPSSSAHLQKIELNFESDSNPTCDGSTKAGASEQRHNVLLPRPAQMRALLKGSTAAAVSMEANFEILKVYQDGQAVNVLEILNHTPTLHVNHKGVQLLLTRADAAAKEPVAPKTPGTALSDSSIGWQKQQLASFASEIEAASEAMKQMSLAMQQMSSSSCNAKK